MTVEQYYEVLGYVASALIILSVLMSSILKLRLFNFFGATLFSIYGFLIGAIPVGLVNGFIAVINAVYLYKMLRVKELFKTISVRGENLYLKEFLEFYDKEIKKFFPRFKYEPEKNTYSFFILRDMNVAGIFMARRYDEKTLWITLDFAIPQYRDFKVGRFVFSEYARKFLNDGYTRLITFSVHKSHTRYLRKMGFKKQVIDGKQMYVKTLTL